MKKQFPVPSIDFQTRQKRAGVIFPFKMQHANGENLTFHYQHVKLEKRLRKRLCEGFLWKE
jgi:hypothetical protein